MARRRLSLPSLVRCLGAALALAALPAAAAKLDAAPNAVLDPLAEPLARADVDVLGSWRSIGAELPPDRPRLASLAAFDAADADIAEAKWLYDYGEGAAAAVALVPYALDDRQTLAPEAFRAAWDAAPTGERLLVLFTRSDAETARHLRSVLEDDGFAGRWLWDAPPAEAGAYFRSAGHHAVLDSPATRRHGGLWLQAWMLDTLSDAMGVGHRRWLGLDPETATATGRGSEIARPALPDGPAGAEPRVPGDRARLPAPDADAPGPRAFPAPPPMTVDQVLSGRATFESLPGGILFGQTAENDEAASWADARLLVGPDDRVVLVSPDGRRRARLPPVPLGDVRPCLAFALRRDPSQSAVHVDARRQVSIAPEFVDSAVGLHLVELDAQPFRQVRASGARKSLVFDRSVRFRIADDALRFHVVLDVWFVVPARDGTARPLLTLRFETSETNPNALEPAGMDGRTDAVSPGAREQLALRLAPVARYAGWIAFFRWAHATGVQFDELWAELARRELPRVRTPRVAPR